jgi:hypothetical protein
MLGYRIEDLVWARGNKPARRELVPDRDYATGEKPDETFRSDCCCAACFAGHERIRFRQTGHSTLARGGRRPDSGQGRARAWARTYGPRRARSPLRMGPRPWSSLRMVQGPRSPPSPLSIRWIRFRHPIARAIRELQRRERVAPMRRGRFSFPNADGCQPSPISTAIRIRSE